MQNVEKKSIISSKIQHYVALEAQNIKKYCTTEELSRLNFKNIDPVLGFTSIYTELTGNINGYRAKRLMKLCTPVVINHDFAEVKVLDNGKTFTRGRIGADWNLSPIEWFLLQTHFCKKSTRRQLLNFLTGKANEILIN